MYCVYRFNNQHKSESTINKTMRGKKGGVLNKANEKLLNDDRIRRIVIANIDKIKEFERLRGARNYFVINNYVANKYDVHLDYYKESKIKPQYISAGLLLEYLEHLGYKLDYIITKVEDNEVI